MADQIRATPRNPFFGLFSDAVNLPLDYMSDPRRTQQMQGLASFLRGTGVPSTLENLSYDPSGRGLFTGAGGLGGTTRLRPEVIDAALTVAPFVGPSARVAKRGAMAAGGAGERLAERVVPSVMERGGLPVEMLLGMSSRTISPLDVYHGTPYRFAPTARNPLGEFDARKIGTGEGAQAFGYGSYVAENPSVGRKYAEQLSTPQGSLGDVAKYWRQNGGENAFRVFAKDVGLLPLEIEQTAAVIRNTGNLYKIDLPDAQIAKMIDFDKPLSKQPEILKVLTPEAMGLKLRVASKTGFMGYVSPDGVPIGLQVKGATAENFRKKWLDQIAEFGEAEGGAGKVIGYLGGTSETSAAQVSQALRQAGIPGIKYFDETSREAGKGTRNFVVFPGEEKSMRILERNREIVNPRYTDPFANTIDDTTR